MDKNTTAALGNFINTAIKQPIGKYVFKHLTTLTTTVRNFIDTSIKHTTQKTAALGNFINTTIIEESPIGKYTNTTQN